MSRPGASAREQLDDARRAELAAAEANDLDRLVQLWIGRIRADAIARVALIVGADLLLSACAVYGAPPGRRLGRAALIGGAHVALAAAAGVAALYRSRPMIPSFAWRTITPSSRIEYRLDDDRRIYVRDLATHGRPALGAADVLAPATWEDGGDEARGHVLRTKGAPSSVARMWSTFGDQIAASADAHKVDRVLVMVQAMCEAGRSSSHPSGYNPRSSRTEPGYPDRMGENDLGDLERDARDWSASGGAHSSHGLAQALISTAAGLVPELRRLDPRSHRGWLYETANSWRTIALYLARLPDRERLDPVRARCAYNAGGVYESTRNAWGARMWSPAVVWTMVAYWNDAQSYFEGREPTASSEPGEPASAALGEAASIATPTEPAPPPIVPAGAMLRPIGEALRAIAESEMPIVAPAARAVADELQELEEPSS